MLDDYTVLPETPKCCATCMYCARREAANGMRYWGCSDVAHIDATIHKVEPRGHCSNWRDKYS